MGVVEGERPILSVKRGLIYWALAKERQISNKNRERRDCLLAILSKYCNLINMLLSITIKLLVFGHQASN